MKKITTIESFPCEKDICKRDDCAKCYTEHCKTEQVPETWEELKELVNKYSGKINCQVGGITVGTTRIMIMMKFDNIYFGKNGNIYFADKYLGTYTHTRQWQIIKNLIGE